MNHFVPTLKEVMGFKRDPIVVMRRHLREQNQKYPSADFVEIPRDQWPPNMQRVSCAPTRVMRNAKFFVQIFDGKDGCGRLSICRTAIDDDGQWRDGITWDELQEIKNGCGYSDRDAIEIYPKDKDVVNVANFRHLWIVPESLIPFAWRAK